MMGMPPEPELLQPGAGLRQRIAGYRPSVTAAVSTAPPEASRPAMLMAFQPRVGA